MNKTIALALFLALSGSSAVYAAPVQAPSHLVVKEWLKGSVRIGDRDMRLDFSILIDIADMEQYLADPLHQAPVTGSVEMGDAAQPLPILEGWCRFFIDSDSPGLKYMTYRLVFDHPVHGRTTLFGKKLIHSDLHGLDLWRDSTTLYVELFEGELPATDSPLPADHGMGTLRIQVRDLIRSIASIRTPGTSGSASLKLKSKFGLLFFGEFWKVYGL